MNATLRRLIWERACERCEYCLISQELEFLPFHVDHIIAVKHDGPTMASNLALACANCSLCKGSNIAAPDPHTNRITRLFHPRKDKWLRHFALEGAKIVGLTTIGRATVAALRMNESNRV